MYIKNRQNSCKFKGCSPLQLLSGLIGLNPVIAYFEYSNRCIQFASPEEELLTISQELG